MAIVATQGLFGLGAAEIAIILVAAAFLLGPQKLAELGRDAGKMAGELKEVPKEFQKGIAEGEKEALKMKEDSMKQIEGSVTIKDAETVEEKK
jgi:sec-independent protein translocase protein TatA